MAFCNLITICQSWGNGMGTISGYPWDLLVMSIAARLPAPFQCHFKSSDQSHFHMRHFGYANGLRH
jgi:hypothetical protein